MDLVSVASVEEAVRTFGRRYLDRVYTAAEQRDCGEDPSRLAARFAAKEATMKVLRPAGRPLPWTAIDVRRSPSGHTDLELAGAAAALADEAGIDDLAVSLTHEDALAGAVVVAHLTPPDRGPS